jgi:aryl-alcohol dehydrogenase-like predicted oxidoreductase
VLPVAQRYGMGILVWSPLAQGLLTGPRTMEQLDDLLAGADVTLTDEILDRIDEIVPPGTGVGQLDMAYRPPAIQQPDLRRRPVSERAAA